MIYRLVIIHGKLDHDGPSEDNPRQGVDVGSKGAPVTHNLHVHRFAGGDVLYAIRVGGFPTAMKAWSHRVMMSNTNEVQPALISDVEECWLVPLVGALTAGQLKLAVGYAYKWTPKLNQISGSGSLLVLTGYTQMNTGKWHKGSYPDGQEFEIYWIHRIGESDQHGGHAHMHRSEMMSSLRGTCILRTMTREGLHETHELVPGDRAVHVPAGLFHDVVMPDGSVLLCIGNTVYDAGDYEEGWTHEGRWLFSPSPFD